MNKPTTKKHKAYATVAAKLRREAQRLLDDLDGRLAQVSVPVRWVFWMLVRQRPNDPLGWKNPLGEEISNRDAEIEELLKLMRASRRKKGGPTPENVERDAKIIELWAGGPERGGRTDGAVRYLIANDKDHPEWATMKNGKPLTRAAVARVIQQRKEALRKFADRMS